MIETTATHNCFQNNTDEPPMAARWRPPEMMKTIGAKLLKIRAPEIVFRTTRMNTDKSFVV